MCGGGGGGGGGGEQTINDSPLPSSYSPALKSSKYSGPSLIRIACDLKISESFRRNILGKFSINAHQNIIVRICEGFSVKGFGLVRVYCNTHSNHP